MAFVMNNAKRAKIVAWIMGCYNIIQGALLIGAYLLFEPDILSLILGVIFLILSGAVIIKYSPLAAKILTAISTLLFISSFLFRMPIVAIWVSIIFFVVIQLPVNMAGIVATKMIRTNSFAKAPQSNMNTQEMGKTPSTKKRHMIRTIEVYRSAALLAMCSAGMYWPHHGISLEALIGILAVLFIHSLTSTSKTKKIPVDE